MLVVLLAVHGILSLYGWLLLKMVEWNEEELKVGCRTGILHISKEESKPKFLIAFLIKLLLLRRLRWAETEPRFII